MLTRNELFGNLTGFVEEHRKTENFFKALKYKENFFKMNAIINSLIEKFGDIEVIECFDAESEDQAKKSFRYISFKTIEGMGDYLLSNHKDLISFINDEDGILEIIIK